MADRNESEDESTAGVRPVILGRLSGLYGVKGWFRVFSHTEPRAALLDYEEWLIGVGGCWRSARLVDGREHGRTIVAKLAGIEDREAAAPFVGADIAVPRETMPETAPGQYYWADLIGLTVRHADGRVLGTLADMIATGAHDVMVVRAPGEGAAGSKEILIPFVVDKYVLDVDLAAGRVDVDWEWD